MSYRIRILPSGRTFAAEPQETLLEAALRAGVPIHYNCTNGTCGECKARLLSGEIGVERFHDYAFTEAEKHQNYILLCSSQPASDLVIEAEAADGAADIPYQEITTRVTRVQRLSPSCMTFQVRTPRQRTLRFLAGQYVVLQGPEGRSAEVAVASCPCNGRDLEFHLRDKGNPFASWALDELAVGSTLELRGPYGAFALDETSTRMLLLVAEGTGFAPVRSLLEHALARELAQPILLVWVAGGTCGHYQANYCRSVMDAVDNVTFTPLPAAGDDPAAAAASVVAQVPAGAAFDLYISARPELTEAVCEALAGRGVAPVHIAVYPYGVGPTPCRGAGTASLPGGWPGV